jgi:hypothetical protein
MHRILTTTDSLPLLISQLPRAGWNCQLFGFLCQNCWLSTETDQSSNEEPVGFRWLSFLPIDFLWSTLLTNKNRRFKQRPHAESHAVEGLHTTGCCPVPKGSSRHCCHHSVTCSPRHGNSDLGFGGLEPLSSS